MSDKKQIEEGAAHDPNDNKQSNKLRTFPASKCYWKNISAFQYIFKKGDIFPLSDQIKILMISGHNKYFVRILSYLISQVTKIQLAIVGLITLYNIFITGNMFFLFFFN